MIYDPLKRIGVGLSRLGTSHAVALGAYAFALAALERAAGKDESRQMDKSTAWVQVYDPLELAVAVDAAGQPPIVVLLGLSSGVCRPIARPFGPGHGAGRRPSWASACPGPGRGLGRLRRSASDCCRSAGSCWRPCFCFT